LHRTATGKALLEKRGESGLSLPPLLCSGHTPIKPILQKRPFGHGYGADGKSLPDTLPKKSGDAGRFLENAVLPALKHCLSAHQLPPHEEASF
jgi:hypothetical protein